MPGVSAGAPDLDRWLPDPALRVAHSRTSSAAPDALWKAAREVTLADAALLGRLVRWRIPGLDREARFDELFRAPPFLVLHEDAHLLVSGLVGRIWTLRRDYPKLSSPEQFDSWTAGGSARVILATWVTGRSAGGSTLASEARVQGLGARGRLGVGAVRPLVNRFGSLIGSDGIAAAVRRAERG